MQTNAVPTEGRYRYRINTLRPAPSMNHDRRVIDATDYADAVRQARESFKATGRATSLTEETGVYSWFRIAADGTESDHNARRSA